MHYLTDYPWLLPAIVVALGLFVYGLKDVLRLSPGRIWAISGVCFRDAIRRRVLWITPLAMIGVIIISQLQRPVDQPDAIRQTIKFCFFATGLVVTVIAIITAATNLPREIENRVVYTIVTKPVTRLEIVLGKIVGFSRVSAAMLLIMGLFTLGYLHLRAWSLGRQIDQTLESPQLDPASREWLKHFQKEGLLFSQTIHAADSMGQYAREPDQRGKWVMGGSQDVVIPFRIERGQMEDPENPKSVLNSGVWRFVFNVEYERISKPGATADGQIAPPEVKVQILDERGENIVATAEQLAGQTQQQAAEGASAQAASAKLDLPNPSIDIPRPIAAQLANGGKFIVQMIGVSNDYLYKINDAPVVLQGFVQDAQKNVFATEPIKPYVKDPKSADNWDAAVETRGSLGRFGQQLRSEEHGVQPVAIMTFGGVAKPEATDGQVPFEMKIGLERGGADADTSDATVVDVRVRNLKSGKVSEPTLVYPESKRTAFFNLPAEYVSDGDFELILRNRTAANYVSMNTNSVLLVSDRESFAINLFKGLFVLWLFSLLVSTIAMFCSTFLSWPIAVVLSLMILLGRWAVMNLDIGTGMGAQFANEFAPNNPGGAKLIDRGVEALTGGLQKIVHVLPDISQFGVTEQIERGATISLAQVGSPTMIVLLFGLPLMTLAYVFLRNKEVAP